MNAACTDKGPHRPFPWPVWLLVFAAAAASAFLIEKAVSHGTSKGMAVDIAFNKNGIPTVLGVPLGKGAVRNVVLQTFSRAKMPVRVLVPSGGGNTPGWDRNFGQSLNAIIKAGLISTNKPSGPSPYE